MATSEVGVSGSIGAPLIPRVILVLTFCLRALAAPTRNSSGSMPYAAAIGAGLPSFHHLSRSAPPCPASVQADLSGSFDHPTIKADIDAAKLWIFGDDGVIGAEIHAAIKRPHPLRRELADVDLVSFDDVLTGNGR